MAEEKRRLARQARDASYVLSLEEEELNAYEEDEQPDQSQKGRALYPRVFDPLLIDD